MNAFRFQRQKAETPNLKKSASLAKRLLASLDEAADSPEIAAAWKEEALDRCAAFDSGQMAERDATDVLRAAYRI
jgi:hypothetical protein